MVLTLDLGADVIHPAPGSHGRPSFTALVGNVDSDTAKYIADSRVQTSRQEMIADLYEMSKVRAICSHCSLPLTAFLSIARPEHVHALQGEGREKGGKHSSQAHYLLQRLA
jgi:hypothetical protein